MPEFEVTISYCLRHTEVYRVQIDNNDPDLPLEEFHESPYDFCHKGNRVKQWEGDIANDSWTEDVKEISPLDRIVEAIN